MNTRDQWILSCLEAYSHVNVLNVSEKLRKLLFSQKSEREDLLHFSSVKDKREIFKELMGLELVL